MSPRSHIALPIYHGQRKHLLEIYSQFGHAPSKRLASPAVEYGVQDTYSITEGSDIELNLRVYTPCIILTI
jgi:hypothetical protein